MKTKFDPLGYAIDEGFVKIFWWEEEGESLKFDFAVIKDTIEVRPIENGCIVIGETYYKLGRNLLDEYGERCESEKESVEKTRKFLTEAKEANDTTFDLLKHVDTYNDRREKKGY